MSIQTLGSVQATEGLVPAMAGPRSTTLQPQAAVQGTKAATDAVLEPNLTASRVSPPVALEDVQQAMEEVRKAITPVAQDLLFSIDEDTGKTIVKVVDASTDEVIRQIPSEEIISIAKALDKLQGLLVKQQA